MRASTVLSLIIAIAIFGGPAAAAAHEWGGRPGPVEEDLRTEVRREAIDARKSARGISVHDADWRGPVVRGRRDVHRHPRAHRGAPDYFFRYRGRNFEVGYGGPRCR
ncbi:MAG: hypothetical protein KC466_13695 [Myxococcales bacterium]|nr:hypothetical protein [Myxococcales bacterium]